MAPKPFLKRGQGKYAKIEYPALRRSGVNQPSQDAPPLYKTSPQKEQNKEVPSISFSPPDSCDTLTIPPPNIPSETTVMGQRNISKYSRTSYSPPREIAFGSRLESRIGAAGEGVRDMMSTSPGLPSGRPRTAGTVDSGFPMEDISPFSPTSSSSETRASSMPSIEDDLAQLRVHGDPLHQSPPASENTTPEARTPPTPAPRKKSGDVTASSVSSTTSSSTKGLQLKTRQVLQQIGEDSGEEQPLPNSHPFEGATEIGSETVTRPQQQRMMNLRLDATVDSGASTLSPIENSDGRPKNVHEFEGDSYREFEDSSSHFRIATSSVESTPAAVPWSDERLQHRPVQGTSMEVGDHGPLDELRNRLSGEEITRTQKRPPFHTRASQATMRRRSNIIIKEESSDENTDDGEMERVEMREAEGRRRETNWREGTMERDIERREWEVEERERQLKRMDKQCRNAIAHSDLEDAALCKMRQEMREAFETKIRELASAYATAEQAMKNKEKEWKKEKNRVEKMQSDLDKDRKQLRNNESEKVTEMRTRFEEMQRKFEEERNKNLSEITRRRIIEENAKKDREEAAKTAAALKIENENMRKAIEEINRKRALARGRSATRAAEERAEDEASSAPRRKGIMKTRIVGGSVNSLIDKENRNPLGSLSVPSIPMKSQVRFDDMAEYDQQSDDTPAIMPTPACDCDAVKYLNGDVIHCLPDRSAIFHYYSESGEMRISFEKERCQLVYYPDGSLNIFRTGQEITEITPHGERINRIERLKDENGQINRENWLDNTLYDEERNVWREQYETGKRVTHRHSWVGKSCVALHSNRDLEFIETNFYAVYSAASRNFELVLNLGGVDEIRYCLRPARLGRILHTGRGSECILFGLQ